MNRRYVVAIITICVITSVICLAAVTRSSVQNYNTKSIQAVTKINNISQEEKASVLLQDLELAIKKVATDEYIQPDYLTYIQEYISTSHVDIKDQYVDEFMKRVDELQYILMIENEIHLRDMTIDGREIVKNLLEQIYKLWGMDIQYNLNGEITLVIDREGNTIYRNVEPSIQGEFHLELLLIIVTLIITLLSLAIIISQKRRIFVKEGMFDGFDEQNYA